MSDSETQSVWFLLVDERGNQKSKTMKVRVSPDCDVDDFKDAVYAKNPKKLSSCDASDLIVYKNKAAFDEKDAEEDATEPLDPRKKVSDLHLEDQDVLYVVVPYSPPIPSKTKHLRYKGMSVEASNRKFLDLIALKLRVNYRFPQAYINPTYGDVYQARKNKNWAYIGPKQKGTPAPRLDDVFTIGQWAELDQLNDDTNNRIHDARLPTTNNGRKSILILEHSKFNPYRVNMLKDIAKVVHIVGGVDDVIVKDEEEISCSSGSSNGSPPNSGGSNQ